MRKRARISQRDGGYAILARFDVHPPRCLPVLVGCGGEGDAARVHGPHDRRRGGRPRGQLVLGMFGNTVPRTVGNFVLEVKLLEAAQY